MTDRIQELMEKLGPGTAVKIPSGCNCHRCAPSDGSRNFVASLRGGEEVAWGSDPIEALEALWDKVKPRTPEQVVKEAMKSLGWNVDDRGTPKVIASALRDAGMLKEPGA